MIQHDKLDAAVLNVARTISPKEPHQLLRRWLRYFPASMYPYIVTKYRILVAETTRGDL